MLGKLTVDALPFYSWVAMGGARSPCWAALIVLALLHLVSALALVLDRVAHQPRSQAHRHHVHRARAVMLLRGFVDAIMMRAQQAIALNSEGYLPPDHFDQIFSSHGTIMIFFVAMPFLTGLFNIVVPQQIGARDVAFPFLNSVSLWLTAAGAAPGAGLAGDRQVLDRRLDRLSALFRHRVQPRRRHRLLDLGGPDQRHRHHADRHQLRRDDSQAPRAGHDPDAHAPVHLDRAVHQRADGVRLPGADGGRRAARPRPHVRHAFLHQCRRRQHDELCQPVLDLGPSGGLHFDPAGLSAWSPQASSGRS